MVSEIDLSALGSGAYVLRICDVDGVLYKQVVINRSSQ